MSRLDQFRKLNTVPTPASERRDIRTINTEDANQTSAASHGIHMENPLESCVPCLITERGQVLVGKHVRDDAHANDDDGSSTKQASPAIQGKPPRRAVVKPAV